MHPGFVFVISFACCLHPGFVFAVSFACRLPETYNMPICVCNACKYWTVKDFDGRYRPGRKVDAPTARAHRDADRMARQAIRQNPKTATGRALDRNSRHVENAVFLATVGGGPPTPASLPVRPRDLAPKASAHQVVSSHSHIQ